MGWIEKLKFETTDLLCGLNKINVNFGDVEDSGFLDWIGFSFVSCRCRRGGKDFEQLVAVRVSPFCRDSTYRIVFLI